VALHYLFWDFSFEVFSGRGAIPHRRYRVQTRSPRALSGSIRKGQQIRWNAGADGIVRMEESKQKTPFYCIIL